MNAVAWRRRALAVALVALVALAGYVTWLTAGGPPIHGTGPRNP